MKVLDLGKTVHNLDVRTVKSQREWEALERIDETGIVEVGGETIVVLPEKLVEIKVKLAEYRKTVEIIATELGVEIVWKPVPKDEVLLLPKDEVPL